MNKMIETYWREYHAGTFTPLAGKARKVFDVVYLVNSLSVETYALAVGLGFVDDQPQIRNWN